MVRAWRSKSSSLRFRKGRARERRLGDVSPASLRRPDSLATATAARLIPCRPMHIAACCGVFLRGVLGRHPTGRLHSPVSASLGTWGGNSRQWLKSKKPGSCGNEYTSTHPAHIRSASFPWTSSPSITSSCARTGSRRRDSLMARFGADIALPDREIFCGQYAQRARRHARDRRDTVPDRSGAVRAALHCQLLLKAANACSSVSPTDDISELNTPLPRSFCCGVIIC